MPASLSCHFISDTHMFTWLEIHNVDVEVIVSRLWDKLSKLKYFGSSGEEGGIFNMAVGKGRCPSLDRVDSLIDEKPCPIGRGQGRGVAGREVRLQGEVKSFSSISIEISILSPL